MTAAKRRTRDQLEAECARLEARVAELEAQLHDTPIADALDALAALSARAHTPAELLALARALKRLAG